MKGEGMRRGHRMARRRMHSRNGACGNVSVPDVGALVEELKQVHAHVLLRRRMNAVSLQ